jgi:hypothetical protein
LTPSPSRLWVHTNLFCVILFKFYLKFNLNTCTCFALTGSLIFVMNVLLISGIKIYRSLTVLYVRHARHKMCWVLHIWFHLDESSLTSRFINSPTHHKKLVIRHLN